MQKFKIKREELDYILTDCSPEELSDIFSYVDFYNYLCSKSNSNRVDEIFNLMQGKRSNYKNVVDEEWASKPLEFYISKKDGTLREISLLQPIALLNIYYYIRNYQYSILRELSNPVFSIRYHVRNNQLFYKGNKKDLFMYAGPIMKRSNYKRIVEQSGDFFNIIKYKNIYEFGNSETWERQCIKYNCLYKIDYKNCFPSIYTHSFNWITTSNVSDSKDLGNMPNLYSELDRTLQNINGRITNGIVVGPEFSRMSAELLLQRIDTNVVNRLKDKGIINNIDYSAFRYVDDIYIFGKTNEICEEVLSAFALEANNYKMFINENKVEKNENPISFSNYRLELNQLIDLIDSLFTKKNDIASDGNPITFYLSLTYDKMIRVRETFDSLIRDNKEKGRIFSSYFLSTILNKCYSKSEDKTFFSPKANNSIKSEFIALLFHIYAPFISYVQTQKIISIFSMIFSEIDFDSFYGFQKCINMYSNFFKDANINDFINLLLFLPNYKTYFPSIVEEMIFNSMLEKDNPLYLATFLIYSQYNSSLCELVKTSIEKRIIEAISEIRKQKRTLEYRQFWYVIIFNKCKFLDSVIQNQISVFLRDYYSSLTSDTLATKAKKIVLDYMLNNTSQFVNWDYKANNNDQMVFRTHYKTIFKKRKRGKRLLSASLI